jgi:hypothetical protein
LIFTTGYLDLVKRFGIFKRRALWNRCGGDARARAGTLRLICGGVLYRNIIAGVWLNRWQMWLALAITLSMGAVFVDASHNGQGMAFKCRLNASIA